MGTKREYRILTDTFGSYPQVRTVELFKKSEWLRIARHPNESFGTYDNLDYPKTRSECLEIIEDYERYSVIKEKSNKSVVYSIEHIEICE